MNKQKLSVLILIIFFISNILLYSQDESKLFTWLKSQPDFKVVQIKADSDFSEAYEIFITQPLDHDLPDGPVFQQKFYISHKDEDLPVVVELDGYDVTNRISELTKLLKCNQVIVEHRYFGESVPDPLNWKYLTIEQAAADHHAIISRLKDFYKGKWISTGISKGGSTVIFHSRFYPDDVNASVAYVGPINLSVEDQRVYEWINTVSTPECRAKVKNFQKLCFEKRNELYPLFLTNAKDKNLSYDIVGSEKAYEYAVLEYSFAYWQWSDGDCSKIPASSDSIKNIWDHLLENGGVEYFSDKDIKKGWPFFYQCYTQYGYYGYEVNDFKDYLKFADGHTPFFIPEGVNPVFDPTLIKDINNWAMNEAKNFIFIYGGNDPWTSTGVCLTGKTNSVKMILPGGSHRTRIKHFSGKDKELIYSRLEKWLDIQIE